MDNTKKPDAHASCDHEKHKFSLDETQKELNHYTEELIDKIKKNPLKAVLIAGGVGMLLSSFLRK